MTNSDHCFPYEINWCHWVPFWWYKHIRMDSNDRNCIFQKSKKKLWRPISWLPNMVQRLFSTQNHRLEFLSAHKHLPGLGRSIIRAPKPQKWARFENFLIFKISPFRPKNQFFGVQKAENWWRTSMSPNIHWKYAVGGQKLPIYSIFLHFSHFLAFFQFFPQKMGKIKKGWVNDFHFFNFLSKIVFPKNWLSPFF